MAIDTVRDVLSAVPGATPTSMFRDPEKNRSVGGAPGSHHTRGTPDNPRAVDLVPAEGESMEQLEARLRSSGLNTLELLNEGDHVHVAVDGRPRDPNAQPVPGQPGFRDINVQDLAPEDTPESLTAAGYQFDAATNRWVRPVGNDAPILPAPLDNAYAERQAARESLALDQEEADIVQAAMIPQAVLDGAGAVAGDVATGLFMEGGTAVLSGAKRGFNATVDLIDETGTWIENNVIALGGFQITDPETGALSVRYLRPSEFAARGGSDLGRLATSENERPETVTGSLIEGVSQFATGWIGGGKILQGWRTVGNAGRIGKAMAQGALADFTAFDGQEERLANLLADHAPEVLAPALNWLAADEDDGELEGRFKNAIEGTVLGGVVDVIGQGVRRLRAARQVRAAAKEAAAREGLQVDPTIPLDEAAVRGEALQASVREALGNPEAPRFRVKPESPEAVAAREARPAPEVTLNPIPGGADSFEIMVGGQRAGDLVLAPGGQPFVDRVEVLPAFRRQGAATAAYEQVESVLGRPLVPSPLGLSEEATAFHKARLAAMPPQEALALLEESRQIGRTFGISEDHLADRLGPLDAAARTAPAAPVITPFQTKVADQAVDGITPAATRASADNVFDINLARINTPEDVQAVIVGMADRMAKDVDLARRGTRSWDQTREAANGVDWVSAMGARQPGGAVNAETALAYRLALNSSATKLLDLARKVEAEPTLANQFAFRRATATHSAIQNELMGARAEAGRALNAFKIPADAPATYLRQIDSLIADVGGANSAQELARRIRMAAEKGDNALNQMVRGGAIARTREIIKLVYTNSLLSGIGTPVINIAGNGMMLGLNFATRAVSPRLAGAFGGNATMQAGEASALVHGYQQAMRDIFRMNPLEAAQDIGANAGERLRRDGLWRGMAPGLDNAVPDGVNLRAEREEAGSTMGRPLSAGAWRVEEDSTLGRFLDVMQMVIESPSNFNSLTDDFFKTVAARGELHAQAFRRVTTEGLTGEEARARYADLIQNPTDDMMSAAEKEMHELTFTNAGGFDKWASAGRRMIDDNTGPIPLGTMVMPFLRTPANLVSVGMRYSPLAPMMKRTRDALAEGGAAAETAKARIAVGTALWSVYIGMAMDGDLTGRGPGNRAQREAMQRQDEYGGSVFQPYSVRVGNRWFSFERADPMGQAMGLMADMADLMKNGDWDEAGRTELDEVAAHAIASIGQAFFDKTMLSGITELTSALLDGSNGEAERVLMSRASAMIPGSSLSRTFRRADDPYLRETNNVVTALMNTMPGLSDDLPPQRDLWGRERRYYTEAPSDQMYNTLGLQSRGQGGSAIDLEILNNGVSVAMPNRSISYAGETVSLKNRPDIYSEFMRLAGEPAFEQLNAVAEGRHPDSEFYFSLTDGPTGGKAEYIREVVSAYRDEARAAVTEMFASDLQAMAADRVRRREEARAGE